MLGAHKKWDDNFYSSHGMTECRKKSLNLCQHSAAWKQLESNRIVIVECNKKSFHPLLKSEFKFFPHNVSVSRKDWDFNIMWKMIDILIEASISFKRGVKSMEMRGNLKWLGIVNDIWKDICEIDLPLYVSQDNFLSVKCPNNMLSSFIDVYGVLSSL